MVDLKAKPFFLNDEQIAWVEGTISSMTLEEIVGQLFIYLSVSPDPAEPKRICETYHIGGLRWQNATAEQSWEKINAFQQASKIPLLVAANVEGGTDKMAKSGTVIAPPPAAGAAQTDAVAYELGRIGGIEAKSVGCNWTFAPISDILFNWRNTIVNNRAFGNDPDNILACCKAYMRGMKESDIACCTKHFPGDGVEERDQHLIMGCNDLSIEEWDASFGRIYKELIDEGIESMMIGHICMPAYQKKYNPSLTDADIMPATLSPELLQNLLREQLGFNGLILTDASHMVGMTCAAPRSEQVPGAIAAGCDMYLMFNGEPVEDFTYMLNGVKDGRISEERLSDALHRILGLKAKQGLHHFAMPAKEGISVIGCEEHLTAIRKCADESVTLVKDTQNLLPVNPSERKRVRLYYLRSPNAMTFGDPDKSKQIVIEELERVGFTVDAPDDFYEATAKHPDDPSVALKFFHAEPAEEFKKKFDLVMVFVNMVGYAQENVVRLRYSTAHSNEMPWYVKEVPTLCVSLNYTTHLFDLPMMKTYINAYASSREYIRAAVEKITGKSDFKGTANDLVWCERWDTRI
ncbi:MAG: glycosyl hydrolase [Lachnospiraceae bacterium]|nr:glycosyl hydrolase [Lachnospiraceae bacterium]